MLKKFNTTLNDVLNTFDNIMENGAFAPKKANAPFFHNIFKNMIFERRQRRY